MGVRPGSVQTDALLPGAYRIHLNDCSGRAEPLAQGWLRARRDAPRRAARSAKVFDLASASIDLGVLHLVTGTRLTGTVHDDTGSPVGGVCVGVNSQDWRWVGGAQTAPDGSYVTDPVLPGTWVLNFNDCRQERTLMNTLWTGASTMSTTSTLRLPLQ